MLFFIDCFFNGNLLLFQFQQTLLLKKDKNEEKTQKIALKNTQL